MSRTKKALAALLILVLLGSLFAGAIWKLTHFFLVDFRFYPRNATALDLRGQEVSVAHYQRLRRRLPNCDITWDVPFQGSLYPTDTESITVTSLTDKDVKALAYLTDLETVDATSCTDYPQLLALRWQHPQADIRYNVTLGGKVYPGDTGSLAITTIGADEVAMLEYLPELTAVTVGGEEDMQNFSQLQAYCQDRGLEFGVRIGDKVFGTDTQAITAEGITDKELNLLQMLPELKTIHIKDPKASAEGLLAYRVACPGIQLSWEQSVCGKAFSDGAKEIDLTGLKVKSLEQLSTAMTYFPRAEKLILDDMSLENESLAAYREQVREQYKVVWTVQCGKKLTCRTDALSFMPVRERVYYFNDEEAYNLRYCEEIEALDIGHMSIHDVSFVQYMPNLKYLILAHTQVQDISPLSTCKNLIFLELDWSPVRDFSPLVGCTALEDLNVGKTYAAVDPLCKLTWLKNLWMVGRGSSAWPVTQALTDTKVVAAGDATVASGWRNLPNYYDMRDALEMHYMSW